MATLCESLHRQLPGESTQRELADAGKLENSVQIDGVEVPPVLALNPQHPGATHVRHQGPYAALSQTQADRYLANCGFWSCDDEKEGSSVTRYEAPVIG